MGDIIACALKSLYRKRLRTLLTVSSITVGVTLVVIVTIIGDAGKYAVNNELENLGMSGLSISTNASVNVNGETGITEENLEIIRQMDNVETAMPLMLEYSFSFLRNAQSTTLICGIDSGATQAISLTLKYGRLISKGDVLSQDNVCVVDESIAKFAYNRENITGKTIRLLINGTQEEFKVIGVADAGSSLLQTLGDYIPTMVYIPYTTMQNLTGRNLFNQVAVRVSSNADIDETENSILERLQKTTTIREYFRADNLSMQRDRLGSLLDIVTLVLTIISGISLLVSGLGIMTIMLVSVNERMREIGIKKSIGATRMRILLEFLTEAAILSLIGSLSGIFVGLVGAFVGVNIFHLPVPIHWLDFIYLILFSLLIAISFGVYPALKASRLHPVESLRKE